MNRPLLFSALVGCVAASFALRAQQPVFRGSSDVVRVFVTVTDKSGRLVTSLNRDNFEVRDEGKPQPITQFDNTPQPVGLIVMLDVSGSMAGNLPFTARRQHAAVRAPLSQRRRPCRFVRERRDDQPGLYARCQRTSGGAPSTIAPDAPTPLWRGIDDALETFKKRDDKDDRRPVILVLSDGKDSGPISFRQRPVSQAEIIDRARRDDVMIYAVGMRSRGARPMQPGIGPGGLQAMLMADLPDPGLARVAEETGGGYIEIRFGQDLGAAFSDVADELHSQYLLGFAPTKRDGKVHEIAVRLNQNGLKSRARKSYVAPKEQ
jgi:Ca-activated chloride channel family protein